MTKVIIFQKSDIYRIMMSGHAGYNEKGKDIVCAGLSTIEYMLTGWIEANPNKAHINVFEEENGYMELEVNVYDADFSVIAQAVEIGLKGLEKEYPEYVKINFEN